MTDDTIRQAMADEDLSTLGPESLTQPPQDRLLAWLSDWDSLMAQPEREELERQHAAWLGLQPEFVAAAYDGVAPVLLPEAAPGLGVLESLTPDELVEACRSHTAWMPRSVLSKDSKDGWSKLVRAVYFQQVLMLSGHADLDEGRQYDAFHSMGVNMKIPGMASEVSQWAHRQPSSFEGSEIVVMRHCVAMASASAQELCRQEQEASESPADLLAREADQLRPSFRIAASAMSRHLEDLNTAAGHLKSGTAVPVSIEQSLDARRDAIYDAWDDCLAASVMTKWVPAVRADESRYEDALSALSEVVESADMPLHPITVIEGSNPGIWETLDETDPLAADKLIISAEKSAVSSALEWIKSQPGYSEGT